MSAPTTTSEIVLKAGGFYRRSTTESYLGMQETLLSQIVEQAPIMIPRMLNLGSEPIHALMATNRIFWATPIKTLPFETNFRLVGGKYLQPCFNWNALATTKNTSAWTCPTADKAGIPIQMMFAMSFGRTGTVYTVSNCWLLVYYKNELYTLPYPNTYNDGHLCMGAEWQRGLPNHKDLMSLFVFSYNSFFATAMNDHLTGDNTMRLFRQDLMGKWIIPDDFEKHLIPVSNPTFSGFNVPQLP